jgi:5'-methylthioadenosine phosphorylase
MKKPEAEIGVFGGSGFYSFLDRVNEFAINTPYGETSDHLFIGEVGGRAVAFLPRHGRYHQYPSHRINYRANIWAMKEIGVTRILAPAACGSLQPEVEPGHFVFCDQFVDRTKGRAETFYDGPLSTHISVEEPYCAELRSIAAETAEELGISYHSQGTAVIIQGPRFSTKAESKWYTSMGWTVVNMTQYPEVALAAELEICYLNISLVTDWDVGLVGVPGVKTVTADEVLRVFRENNEKLKTFLFELIPRIPRERCCKCQETLKYAVISPPLSTED